MTTTRPRPFMLLSATIAAGLVVAGAATAGPAAAAGVPTPVDDAYTVDFGTTRQVAAPAGLLADDDPGSFGAVAVGGLDLTGLRGSADVGSDGSLRYTPPSGFVGQTSFTYRLASRTGELSATAARVTLTVGDVAARPDSYRLAVGVATLTVDNPGAGLLANDLSAGLAVGGASLATGPAHGGVDLTDDGTFSYSPTPGFAGTDTFTYAVTGGTGSRSTATVTITVDPPNSDLAVTLAKQSPVRTGATFTLRVTVTAAGPSVAKDVVVSIDVDRTWTVTTAPGGIVASDGHSVGYSMAKLAVGSRKSFDLTVAVPAGASTTARTMTAAARSLSTVDFTGSNDRAVLVLRARPAP